MKKNVLTAPLFPSFVPVVIILMVFLMSRTTEEKTKDIAGKHLFASHSAPGSPSAGELSPGTNSNVDTDARTRENWQLNRDERGDDQVKNESDPSVVPVPAWKQTLFRDFSFAILTTKYVIHFCEKILSLVRQLELQGPIFLKNRRKKLVSPKSAVLTILCSYFAFDFVRV